MGSPRAGGRMVYSSLSSGIFFQGNVQSPATGNAQLESFGNMTNPIPGNIHPNVVSVSGDSNKNIMNCITTSGPSIGESSIVTDANSGLSGGGPRLQRSASINTESYSRLPASPLSFSSHNPSISGSTIIDGPSAVQQNSNQDPHQMQQQGHCQGAPTTRQLPPLQLPNGSMVPRSFAPDHDNVSPLQKKRRLDIQQEDVLEQQLVQQILQRQDSMQFQNPNPQLQALIQQQRLRQQQQQQQQLLQSLPPVQRAHLLQQQQQQQIQLRQLQQQGLQPPSAMKRTYNGDVCSRRLMQYLFHQRQRPADNSIAYWRKFVAEYYSPRAKKRWCLSLYDNIGHHSPGVFPQEAVDSWHCDICGSKSGRGFEATFEILPRLNEIKFSSGVVDELLYLDLPRESRFPNGTMMLEYGKAVQESIYEQLRVVHQGRLKVIFTHDLKILTWEFCARRHEELIPRQLVLPQVNQLLQVVQKCQSTIAEGRCHRATQQDLQTTSNMAVTALRQFARNLDSQSLNDLGFSKSFVRCLQTSEVASSMKDLIDFCLETKVGPIEGMKSYPPQIRMAKLQKQKMQEMDKVSSIPGLPTDRTALHPGIKSPANSSHQMPGPGAPPSGTAQSALTLTNYQNMLMRQNSMNSNCPPESLYMNNSNQNGSVQGCVSQNNIVSGGFPNSHLLHQQQPLPPSQGGSQAAQPHMIQQLLQDMNNNNNGGVGPKPSVSGQSGASGSMGRYGRMSPPNGPGCSSSGHVVGPTRSNSFKGPSHSDTSAGGGNIVASSQKSAGLSHLSEDIGLDIAAEFTENGLSHLSEDIGLDIAAEFMENGFFNNDDFEDLMGYGWN